MHAYFFENLTQVRELTENWMNDYNESRPHESI
ncbi:MAG: hypothetical protein CVU10_10015 [Bacteroidetes bacterium HGW-Bacteroidetes-5]|nr:MAG: hypothetical protein CVU10_10015 [Bacteroidetes bacterium HGW-Bacteroidetes-5]